MIANALLAHPPLRDQVTLVQRTHLWQDSLKLAVEPPGAARCT